MPDPEAPRKTTRHRPPRSCRSARWSRALTLGVAAEEDAGVGDVDRLQSAVRPARRHAVRLVLEAPGRPGEARRVEARQSGLDEPEPQAFEPLLRKAHLRGNIVGWRQHRKGLEARASGEEGELPDTAHLGGNVIDRGVVETMTAKSGRSCLRASQNSAVQYRDVSQAQESTHLLLVAIRELAATAEAVEDGRNEYGVFLRTEGVLTGPNGRDLAVVTIWLQSRKDGQTRFVTLRPRKEKR